MTNAFEIIAHGINLHRTEILTADDLEELIDKDREIHEFDLDETYERKVKALYARILDFISHAHADLPPEFIDQLYALRRSCRQIVMTVKEIKHIRKNVTRYMVSTDEDIRKEYNALRVQLAQLLREIHDLRETPEEERNVVELDAYRVAIDEENSVVNGELDTLIRNRKITAEMGTSLINDHGYARDAIWHLTDIAKTLFGSHDLAAMEAEELIGLDDDDIEAVAHGA